MPSKMTKYYLFLKISIKQHCFEIIQQNTTLLKLKIVKIEFCVELDVTNIEFHACFAVVAGANVTFLIKNSMSNSVLEKMSFVQFFLK